MIRFLLDVLAVVAFAFLVWVALVLVPPYADARMERVTVTWYGPGFYGNTFACAGRHEAVPRRYWTRVRGVAHRTLPCGSRVTLCRRGRCVRVRVIDRGPYSGATFDLTARTAMDLCRCTRPFTTQVVWARGWQR